MLLSLHCHLHDNVCHARCEPIDTGLVTNTSVIFLTVGKFIENELMLTKALIIMPRLAAAMIAVASLTTVLAVETPVNPPTRDAKPAGETTVQRPTFCNPIDLPYRFMIEPPSRREAADPTLVRFDGEYWLFASKSGGYWHTRDFLNWIFVEAKVLPVENYAPTAEVIGGQLYFYATGPVFRADDARAGRWTKVGQIPGWTGDPDLFCDDDGRVYLYWGCSDKDPIRVQEVDPRNGFKLLGESVVCIGHNADHGFEVGGENHTNTKPGKNPDADAPQPTTGWNEGPWMTKHRGRYYLQYAAPGTSFREYADGVYVSDHPMGPFSYAPYSPFSHKPGGFLGAAGHSSTFQDKSGNYWHIVTATIAQHHIYERRLALYPMTFTADGQMVCHTVLGDLPQFTPDSGPFDALANQPGWMELAGGKPATASSEYKNCAAGKAVDENIQTWWSAATGDAGEWLRVDLTKPCRINAFQFNFADDGSTVLGRLTNDAYRYYVEVSADGTNWTTDVDRRDNLKDAPHEYVALATPITARYVRITNQHTPANARFSLSGLRVFGSDLGAAPAPVTGITATRNADNARRLIVNWQPVPGAKGYLVRYGLTPDHLFDHAQVMGKTSVQINSLNLGVSYVLTVDAYNDRGVTPNPTRVEVR